MAKERILTKSESERSPQQRERNGKEQCRETLEVHIDGKNVAAERGPRGKEALICGIELLKRKGHTGGPDSFQALIREEPSAGFHLGKEATEIGMNLGRQGDLTQDNVRCPGLGCLKEIALP